MMHTNALCSSIVWLPPRGARGSRSPTRALHGYTYAFPAQVGRDMALLHRPPLAHGASFLRC